MTNSIFATKNTPAKQVTALVDNVDEVCDADGTIKRAEMVRLAPDIGYTRAYLIIKRAWLEANDKKAIKAVTKTAVAAATKKFQDRYSYERHVLGPIVVGMRLEDELSWGDIAIRLTSPEGTNIPESKVRDAFRKAEGHMKDKGLRIGKGGRYAYDDGSLYSEHRQAEGAVIKVTQKGRPTVTDLLNGEAKLAEVKLAPVKQTA